MASGPITSWEIDGETVETVSDFIFLGSKITADGDCCQEIKRHLLLGRTVMTNLDIEAEDVKKRWQEYTEELYEKDLHDPDNHTFPSPGDLPNPGTIVTILVMKIFFAQFFCVFLPPLLNIFCFC